MCCETKGGKLFSSPNKGLNTQGYFFLEDVVLCDVVEEGFHSNAENESGESGNLLAASPL